MTGQPRRKTERRRAAKADRERRRKLRRRLEAEGVDQAEIDRQCDALRAEHLERRIDITYAELRLDDSGYKPTSVDPLERGPARVTKRTATAARRKNATTRYELGRREAG